MSKSKAVISKPIGLLANSAPVGLALLCLLLVVALPSKADHTRFWRQSDFENFDRGTAKGTAVRSDGRITLAPKFTQLADAGLGYLWDLKLDSHGNVYAAGGSNAKVVRVDASSKMSTIFDSGELSAQALAIDRKDNLYVGTSPDGKVYKVTPDGKKSMFFDPQAKYIWAIAPASDGTLYVATGDGGNIFSVSPEGKGDLFYTSSETHIRSLALDGKGNLLAGTEPNGLVLRIPLASPAAGNNNRGNQQSSPQQSPARQAYVLYETTRREITSLLINPSGDIYVGAIGEKTRAPQPAPPAPPAQQPAPAAGQGGPAQQPQVFQPFPTVNSSAVYHIAPDGAPEELWNSRDDVVYSLANSENGALLLGTGNQGAVIQLEKNRVFSRLVKSNTAQVTGLARGANGKVFVATANPAKIFSLGPEQEAEGTFESQPFDARIFSRWGRLTWFAENGKSQPAGIDLYVRAGNTSDPENNWSPWAGPYHNATGDEVQAPAARFAQWKAVLRGGRGPAPELSWVDLAYLPKNIPPRIDAIAIQNPGIRLAGGGGGQGQAQGNVQLRLPTVPAAGGNARQGDAAAGTARNDPQPQGSSQKGQQAVIWAADDPNDDELTYAVYYRGENEKDWKLLRDKLTQKFYSWDTTSMPDGAYYVRVVASDEKSNAPGEALTAEREGDRFVVDNTPPEISGVAADVSSAANAREAAIRFKATDANSAVVTAQYSLDAGDWILVLPTNGVSDSLDESYSIALHDLTPGEHTIAVRAYDQYDNLGAGKVTFTIPPARK